MEVRSSRRVRTLVTQMARSGLSANEIAPALIPMMARSETLQSKAGYIDARPLPPYRQNSLATHGRTIHWVIRDRAIQPRCRPMSAMHPEATKILQRRDWSLCANSGHRRILFDHFVGAGALAVRIDKQCKCPGLSWSMRASAPCHSPRLSASRLPVLGCRRNGR